MKRAHCLCFTLRAENVPANAQLFGDVREQVALLRAFSFVCLRLWKDVGHAVGRVAWDAEGTTRLAVFFADKRFDGDAEFASEANEALAAFIALDMRQASRAPARRPARWAATQLLVDEQQWLALHAVDSSSAIGIAACSPVKAWLLPKEVDFLGSRSATLLRLHLRENVLWHKLLPHQQEALYPDIPFVKPTLELQRSAATVPLPPGACKLSEWELFQKRSAKMRGRDDYGKWALRQLCCTLQGELAGYVPAVERSLNEWELAPLSVPWPHSNLSSFGTWATFMVTNMECFAFVFSQHLLCLKSFLGALDVYLEKEAGSLHFSMLLAGPAATSKSFTLQLLANMLVPGTVSVATRRTANSKSYDVDSGAAIDIEHELPKDFFGSVRDNPRGGQTKDVLTSHVFVTEALHMTEDGRRMQIISKSRCHRGVFAATNDIAAGGLESNDQALLSRFDTVFPSMGANKVNKDVLSVLIREKDPSPEDEAGLARFLAHTRTLHVCAYWVLRCISGHVLPDVDFSALKLVLSEVKTRLRIKAPPARTTERIFSLARVATVIQALVEEFALPGAPQHGEVPTVERVQAVRPRLVCTAEVAKFCIELQKGELEAPHRSKILEGFKSLALETMEGNINYLYPKGCQKTQQVCRTVAMACGEGSGVTADLVAMMLSKLQSEQLASPRQYRVKVHGDNVDDKFPVAVDDTAEGACAAAAMGFSVHAHLLDNAGDAASGLLGALEAASRSAQHDEVRAAAQADAAHRLLLRPKLPKPRASKHKITSGVYVTEDDWNIAGGCPPKNDNERNYAAIQVDTDVERYAKRPRLLPPAKGRAYTNAKRCAGTTHMYK